ncbi:MAG: hypothetical protein HYR94_25875, partial [Chloroflexi bacterium]|nr:hypothetical protein [Chloroflexota bacterium]
MLATIFLPLTPSPRPPGYWQRLAAWFSLTLMITLLGLPIILGFLMMWSLVYPPCAEAGLTPGDFGFDYEDVTLSARAGGKFRGYFVPG